MKKILCLTALAATMSLTQVPLVYANQGMCSGRILEKIVHKLDLTADQKTKIDAIAAQYQKDRMPKFQDIKNIEMQMNDIVKSNNFDEAKIDDLVGQEKDILATTIKMRVMEKHDIYAVLTDAQKAKLDDMIQKWKAKHEKKDHD